MHLAIKTIIQHIWKKKGKKCLNVNHSNIDICWLGGQDFLPCGLQVLASAKL